MPDEGDQFDEEVIARIAAAIEPYLLPGEVLQDVIEGAKHLASVRAQLLDRPILTDLDIIHVLRAFTWWPFKPRLSVGYEDQLHAIRGRIFEGAASGDFTRLDAAMRRAALLLTPEGLRALQLHGTVDDLVRV
jgi:hypothetical protein